MSRINSTHRILVAASLGLAALPAASAGAASSLWLFGPGTPGTAGLTPRIWAEDTAYPGNASFRVTVDRAVGGTNAVLLIGAQPLDVLASGFHLSVDPILLLPPIPLGGSPGTPGAGSLTLPLPIPNLAVLLGFDAYFQWVVLDSGASYLYSSTPGLRVTIGDPPRAITVASVAGSPDPVQSVDPATGLATDWTMITQANLLQDVQFAPDGASALVSFGGGYRLIDAATGAPIFTVNVGGAPNCAAFTPDGRRAYGVAGGPAGQGLSSIVEIDCDSTSPTYGTQIGLVTGFPLAFDQWEGVGISGDGRTLTAANLGLSNPSGVVVVDIDPASANYNMVRHWIPNPTGGFTTDVEPIRDGTIAYAAVAYLTSLTGDVLVIDCVNGTVQSVLGSIGTFPTDVDIDGRDEVAFIACPNSNSVARLRIDPNGPAFHSWSTLPLSGSPFALAISPDAHEVYVVFQASFDLAMIDAASLSLAQTFTLPLPCSAGVASR